MRLVITFPPQVSVSRLDFDQSSRKIVTLPTAGKDPSKSSLALDLILLICSTSNNWPKYSLNLLSS